MKLHVSPEIARATYDMLRTTPPFRRWKLPSSEEVSFVCKPMKVVGYCDMTKVPTIMVGINYIGTIDSLTRLLAHEMCHMRQWQVGQRSGAEHGARFAKLADSVCKYHGFDRKAF